MRITESKKITDFFGCNVFNDGVMQKYMPRETYNELKEVTDLGKPLNKELANKVAKAMKEWAGDMGATHYTHWFQPLTGTTAEKHDSFISIDKSGNTVLEFTGSNLRKGEADASSFPSGGIRATFEARGYTVWDCSSPAFIKKSRNGAGILCIPTAFCSYTGEALDKKTPLLRSMEAINREGVRLLKILGVDAERVTANVGGEQEYFLIDKRDYNRRDDLKFTGRTLFGAMPPKGQEKNDQYYATIKDRVSDFMAELNEELWKLGITAKTQHNEVAPAQHELAPIFCTANIATDQNQLIMETLKKVADNHGLTCLLHEKPFAGVNGSGKHNNWSLTTDTGHNLLEPGRDPQKNRMFLLVLAAMMKAVDEHAGLLRMSAANPGNDHRLGANEAPPAIISMFLGDQLTAVVDHIIRGSDESVPSASIMRVGVSTLPFIRRDATDRNRTSPFAFTGNKFEFRMVPSSGCIADANTVLNTIAAEAFQAFADELEKAEDFEFALNALIRREMTAHQRIIFNGNGYTDEWVAEATRRGLPNLRSMVDAVPELVKPASIALFAHQGVFTEKELRARADVSFELYAKTINIEALTMIDMAGKDIVPAVAEYGGKLAWSANQAMQAGMDVSVQREMLARVNVLLRQTSDALADLRAKQEKMAALSGQEQARYAHDVICPAMEVLRAPVDHLEMIVDGRLWPMPTYGDLLFNV